MNNTKPEKICPLCKGTYFVKKIIGGKEFAERCSCYIKILIEENIPANYRKEFIETDYKESYFLKAVLSFLLPSDKHILFLWGSTGVGKTHLAWIFYEMYGILMKFRNMSQINSRDLGKILRLRTVAFSTIEEENETKYQKLINSNFIFIDEFWVDDTVRTSEFCSWFSMFLDELDDDCKLIVTSNYNPEAIKQVDMALYSRLVDREKSVIMKMEGKNWRLQ